MAIVTGFYIPGGDPPAAETDGPPGALLLAQTLLNLGIDAFLLTDPFCLGAVTAAAASGGFPRDRVLCCPESSGSAEFWNSHPAADLSHLIAIERAGPSHTIESLARQPRVGPAPVDQFAAKVPAAHRDCCHNMRGENIDRFTGQIHRLFEEAADRLPRVATIGIGDGANEIGMGAAAWEDLERRLSGAHSGWVPCRIATDWNIVAGTSNWGGYALAAAVALLRGDVSAVASFDSAREQRLLDEMVEHGPAVDGVTRRREPTVDGLPFLTYIQPWIAIRAKLGHRE